MRHDQSGTDRAKALSTNFASERKVLSHNLVGDTYVPGADIEIEGQRQLIMREPFVPTPGW